MKNIQSKIQTVCQDVFGDEVAVELTQPEFEFGDLSTNIAMQEAKKLGQNPRGLAEELATTLQEKLEEASSVSVAGPGFINIFLKDKTIYKNALGAHKIEKLLDKQIVVAEYSDPNPFKVLHVGHLYTSLVGDSISNICEMAGATVHRVNFGGDVGLHVAKAMWAIIRELGGEHPEKLQSVPIVDRPTWISNQYVKGNIAYGGEAKAEITRINSRVYEIHSSGDKSSSFAQIYWTCRQWSYDGFDALYKRLAMKPFEKYYPESSVAELGVKTVKEGLEKGIFEESEGAIIFDAEDAGLHKRVFLNSEGLPTYEAKDLGLSLTKWRDYHFDKSLIITGNDIKDYMKVVLQATRNFQSEASSRTVHRTHGQVKLLGGQKMSSREGNVLLADDILDSAKEASSQKENNEQVVLGAVRYSFLKTRLGADIIYDPARSVSLDGNSGPYIQYALVRARSILNKTNYSDNSAEHVESLEDDERLLARKLNQFPNAFEQALKDYSPHHICNYLFDLAHSFNSFYENNRVVGSERQQERLALVLAYERVLSTGLDALGMPKPERM